MGRGLAHVGTVGFRGPVGPSREVLKRLGLHEAEATALEFVASWFGAPLDAVNVRSRRNSPLSWGFWHLCGDELAAALASFKARAPESFAKALSTHGIDVVQARGAPNGATTTTLAVTDPRRALSLRGETAEAVIATEPRLIAALARAGREREGHLAQIETVVVRRLSPARAVAVPSTAKRLGDVLRSPRALAVLFFVDLCFGKPGAAHLAAAVAAEANRDSDGTEPTLLPFVERLRRAGGRAEAHDVLRILASPELP